MKNNEILQYASALNIAFQDIKQNLPAKVNFCIQKNAATLLPLAREVEEARSKVFQQYGELQEDGSIKIPPENIAIASEELNGLFDIDQEVKILKFSIEALGNTELSMEQMNAIMFMIEEG